MGTKRWRPQLLALGILLAFIGFSYSYVRYFVRARTHSVIVFFVPGASPELLALAQAREPSRRLPGLGRDARPVPDQRRRSRRTAAGIVRPVAGGGNR